MDDKLQQAVRHLSNKHSSSSNVYNALVTIRTNYVKDSTVFAEFRRLGGLQALIFHLQKPNVKIVNVALSILGNCCMEVQSRILVRKHGGILHVVNLLESLGQEDIQNRACRVLANLAMDVLSGDEIVKRNGAKLIIDVLSSSKEEHTKVSALRAIRSLSTSSKQREHVIKQNGVESICKLLILEESSKQETLSSYILKALAALTVECSLECSLQLQNVQYAEKLVAFLSASIDQTTGLALRVLSNLSKHETIRPLLGSAGAVPLLIKHVAKWERTSLGWQHAVITLCQCTKEGVNRVRVREEDGLIHLITLLGDHEDDRMWCLALAAIANFLFDNDSFTKLVELGLVAQLVERFRELIVKAEPTAHDYDPDRPVKKDGEEKADPAWRGGDVDACSAHQFNESTPSYHRSLSSPRGYCRSPECSPPYWTTWSGSAHLGSPPLGHSPPSSSSTAFSPYRAGPSSCSSGSSERPTDVAEDGDFCYSPVYEEDDGDVCGNDETVTMETAEDSVSQNTPIDSSQVVEEEEEEDLSRPADDGLAGSPLADVIMLLARVSWQEDPRMSFVSSGAFAVVFEYVVGTKRPSGRAQRMLLRILRNPQYFECLLLYRIPQFLHQRLSEVEHPISGCSLCKTVDTVSRLLLTNISLQAESAYGCGVLVHWLVGKTDSEQKLLAIIAANYLLSSCRSRRKVYVESIGLSYLCQTLENVNHVDYKHLLGSFVHLSKSVLSQTPIPVEVNCHLAVSPSQNRSCCPYVDRLSIGSSDDNDEVLLAAWNDSRADMTQTDGIKVSRTYVGERCDVLHAMLNGNFAETGSRKVFIGDTTLAALKYAVHHLYGCSPSSCPVIRVSAESVSTLLQVLAIADRFLLADVKLVAARQLTVNSGLITDDEFLNVLLNAKLYGCQELVRWVYVDMLTSNESSLADKCGRLSSWMTGDRSGEITADLQVMLHEALTSKC